MKRPVFPRIKHNVDPMRYPKVQKPYEDKSKSVFNAALLFGDIVQTMVDIQKEKK